MPVFLLYAGREWNGQIHDKLSFPYLKKGDMLLITPRMSVSLKSKSMEFNSYGICIEPSFFDSLAVGSYAYKSLYNSDSMTLALQLDNDDFAYVHKTLELLAHSLISNYPVE